MSHEPTYDEALDKFTNVTYIRERFGRKVVRDGKWVRDPLADAVAELMDRSEKKMAQLKDAVSEPETPCSLCGSYGHFTHRHEG